MTDSSFSCVVRGPQPRLRRSETRNSRLHVERLLSGSNASMRLLGVAAALIVPWRRGMLYQKGCLREAHGVIVKLYQQV